MNQSTVNIAIDTHHQQEGLAETAISKLGHTVSEGILTSQVQHSEESNPGNIKKRESAVTKA